LKFTIDPKRTNSLPELQHIQASTEDAIIPVYESESLRSLITNFNKKIPEIGYFVLHDVYVLGNGFLIDKDGRRIQSRYLPYTLLRSKEGIKRSSGPISECNDGYVTTPRKVTEVNEPVALLTQPGDRIFGHWIVDILPKLAMINSYDPSIRCIIKSDVINGSAIKDIDAVFDIIGFDKNRAIGIKPASEAVLCKKLIVPSVVRYGQQIHSFVKSLYEPFRLPPSDPHPNKKLYFSRRLWQPSGSHRILSNAQEVEEYYRANGYDVVFPERLTFKEKLIKLANASHVAGEKGSALHLSLFSSSIKEMTVLLNPSEPENGLPLLQAEICRLQGINCHIVIGQPSLDDSGYTIKLP
jgi:hypothetical protein